MVSPVQAAQPDHFNLNNGYVMYPNGAQYKGSDYSNAIRVERHISLEEAFKIADSDPDIEYFFYTTGMRMVLEIPPEEIKNLDWMLEQDKLGLITFAYGPPCRIFHYGDTVFFIKRDEWVSWAEGANLYFKKRHWD